MAQFWRTSSTPTKSTSGSRADKENNEQLSARGMKTGSPKAGSKSTPIKSLLKTLQTLSIANPPLSAPTPTAPPLPLPTLSVRTKQRIISSRYWAHTDLLCLLPVYHQTAQLAAQRGRNIKAVRVRRPEVRVRVGPTSDTSEGCGKENTVKETNWRIMEITAIPPCKVGNPSTPMRRASSLLHRFKHGPEDSKRQVRKISGETRRKEGYTGGI